MSHYPPDPAKAQFAIPYRHALIPLPFLLTFLSLLWFQSRFADALLRELAGVTIPPERIYGLGTGFVLLFDIFSPVDVLWCTILILHYVSFILIASFH